MNTTDTPEPAPGATDPQPEVDHGPKYHHGRTGFVARLPKAIRDKVNLMLLDGFPHQRVIEALGPDGEHLNHDHIRSWKEGGYKDWLEDFNRNEALRLTREATLEMLDQKAGQPVQDASRTLAAAQLYELLKSFEPTAFAAALLEKPELYLRLINALSRLCEGDAACAHHRTSQALIATRITAAVVKASPEAKAKAILSAAALKEVNNQIKLI